MGEIRVDVLCDYEASTNSSCVNNQPVVHGGIYTHTDPIGHHRVTQWRLLINDILKIYFSLSLFCIQQFLIR